MAKPKKGKQMKLERKEKIVRLMKERIQRIKTADTVLKQRTKGITQRAKEVIKEMGKKSPDMKKVEQIEQTFQRYKEDTQTLLRHVKNLRKGAESMGMEEPSGWAKVATRASQAIIVSNATLEFIQGTRKDRGI